MKKKIIASIVVLTLLFGMLPIYSQASDELRNPRIIDKVIKTISLGNGYYSTYYNQPCVTWDCVYFGNYWQKDSEGNIDKTSEKQPIKWRVLSVDGDDLFLLTDESIYKGEYKKDPEGYWGAPLSTTWIESDIKNWIDNDFSKEAFSSDEFNDILETNTMDKISILSETDLKSEYGFVISERHTGLIVSDAWWLRSAPSYNINCTWIQDYNTYIHTDNPNAKHYIRPALHLKKSSTHYKKAGTVNIYNEIDVERTPKPLPTMIPTQTPIPTSTPIPQSQTPKKVVKKVTAPSKPTKVKVKNNKKKTATVTWSKVSGAKGYRVQYAYSAPFSKKTKTVSTNKFVAKKLKKKKTYSFRVRAYKMNGKKKLYGKWSKVVRIKIKK
jgi:hypothetical protein